jgi:hypothetical protein
MKGPRQRSKKTEIQMPFDAHFTAYVTAYCPQAFALLKVAERGHRRLHRNLTTKFAAALAECGEAAAPLRDADIDPLYAALAPALAMDDEPDRIRCCTTALRATAAVHGPWRRPALGKATKAAALREAVLAAEPIARRAVDEDQRGKGPPAKRIENLVHYKILKMLEERGKKTSVRTIRLILSRQ